MCYHKSLVAAYEKLRAHYAASFDAIHPELELIRERMDVLLQKQNQQDPYSKQEVDEMKWCQKTISSFSDTHYTRYHENGFDYLASPIITAGAPEEFKLFRWGLIPYYMAGREKAFALRPSTLNCISEEMYEKPSFRDAAKNGQRCLIPVTGFYEWHWADDKGKTKIPYYISPKDRPVMSLAGLYSRWNDKQAGQYYYTYTVLTTQANPLMATIHNSKKRMPVVIAREHEKDWLNRDLTREDVLALCRPIGDKAMKAHTISKLITTKDADTNVADVLKLHEYEKTGSK